MDNRQPPRAGKPPLSWMLGGGAYQERVTRSIQDHLSDTNVEPFWSTFSVHRFRCEHDCERIKLAQ